MDFLARFPSQIAASSKTGAQSYKLIPGLYAVHGLPTGTPAPNAAYLLNDGTIAVFRGSPDPAKEEEAKAKLSAVYELGAGGQKGGSPSVPTGLVFLRLADGVDIRERAEEIKGAGYEIAETISYALNAAWLRALSNDIADALRGVASLEKIKSVENVEPQMLMESARR